MPLLDPIKGLDGHNMDELFVPKGTLVMLSYAACNTSISVWGDDVLEWKPQRWLSPLPSTVIRARIPGVYSNLSVAVRLQQPADLLTTCPIQLG